MEPLLAMQVGFIELFGTGAGAIVVFLARAAQAFVASRRVPGLNSAQLNQNILL